MAALRKIIFSKKYAESIKKLPVCKYSSQSTLILNYFAFSASQMRCAGAPPQAVLFCITFYYHQVLHIFLFCAILISFVYQTLRFNISFYISNNQYFEEYVLYNKTYINFLCQLLIYQIYNKAIKAYIYIFHLYIYNVYNSCNVPKKGAPACSHMKYGCFTQNNIS